MCSLGAGINPLGDRRELGGRSNGSESGLKVEITPTRAPGPVNRAHLDEQFLVATLDQALEQLDGWFHPASFDTSDG